MLPYLNRCYSKNDCPVLDKAKLSYDLQSVKYICDKLKTNYLEFLYGNADYTVAISRAKSFRDLLGCKYVLQKFNKEYPADLYNSLEIRVQEKLASELLDLEGIKYIYNGTNHLKIYSYTELAAFERIEFAVRLNDLTGLQYYSKDLPQKNSNKLLKLAYYKEHLKAAEYLISNLAAKFDLNYVIRLYPLNNLNGYQDHLVSLNNSNQLTQQEAANFQSLINSLYAYPEDTMTTVYSDDNHSYFRLTTLFEDNLRSHHSFLQDIIKFILINNVDKSKIDFLVPSNGIEAFFNRGDIAEPYKEDYIYIPGSHQRFNASFIHELGHAFFYILFNNHGKPYKEYDSSAYKKYVLSINETLINLAIAATKGKYNNFEDINFESMLWLNYRNITGINTDVSIEFFFSKISNKDYKYSKEQKRQILDKYYNKYYLEFNWNDELAFVLNRMFDYMKRPNEYKHSEFIVRLPEFYAHNVSSTIMRIFQPIEDYWNAYVSPTFKDYINNHYLKCKHLINAHKTIDDCVVITLSLDQRNDLLIQASEVGCASCVKTVYSSLQLVRNIDSQIKEKALAKASENINYCVKVCLPTEENENQCEYIQPAKLSYLLLHWGMRLLDGYTNWCYTINKPHHELNAAKANNYQEIIWIISNDLVSPNLHNDHEEL